MGIAMAYYCCIPPQPTSCLQEGYTMVKIGIHGQTQNCRTYVRARYGKGTQYIWGIRFKMSLRSLETSVEQPVLEDLKTRSDLCKRVTGKKEHFWVENKKLSRFVEHVKQLVRS